MSNQVFARMLINGESRESDDTSDTINPATGEAFATCFSFWRKNTKTTPCLNVSDEMVSSP